MEWVKISNIFKPEKDSRRKIKAKIAVSKLLVSAIVSINTVYFRSYTKTEVSGNKWAGIREAFNNETFSTINVTLGLPLITLILNEVFDVDTAIAEKTGSIKEKRLAKRVESIEKFDLLNKQEAKKKEEMLEKIRIQLEK